MTNEDGVFFKIEGGKVSKMRTVEAECIRLTDFMKNLADQSPQIIETPALPANTVKYIKQPHGASFLETFIVYSPPQMLTVSYRGLRRHGEREHSLYDASFPGMLFKFTFDPSGNMGKPMVAITKVRPQRDQERIYTPLIPNIFNDRGEESGEICMTPMNIRGDKAKSCTDTIINFFTGQPFNDDLNYWPPGVSNFSEWQQKTRENPRWIEEVEWPYLSTFGEWYKVPCRIY